MAYWKPIAKYLCGECGSRGTVEVFNQYNSSFGFYCLKCGKRKVRSLKAECERVAREGFKTIAKAEDKDV